MRDNQQFGSYLIFDGIQSNEYGVWISGTETYDEPEPDMEFISIPGRAGDLIRSNKRLKNRPISYPAFISRGFERKFDVFKAAMLSRAGRYCRLEDTYHPDTFRLAAYLGGTEPTTRAYNRSGAFDIQFNCRPERFLKSGEVPTVLTTAGSLFNPTLFTALPLIRVYGYGTVGIGAVTVTVATNALPYIDIDCEAQDAFCGAQNANGYISTSGYDFPSLAPGETGVTVSGSVTRVEITPRWWTA